MTRLLLRVGAAIGVSLGFSFLWVARNLAPEARQLPDVVLELVLDAGLHRYHRELLEAPPEGLEARMEALRTEMSIPAVVLDEGSGGRTEPWSVQTTWVEGEIRLPVGDRLVAIGPFPLPLPTARQGASVAMGVTLIVVLAASIVVVPITRRLRRIELALERFRAGDLSVRLSDPSPDAIGKMALGFNDMAMALEQRIRRQEELLQAVSHEYGTPLARLALRTEMLAKRLPPEHEPRLEDIRKDLAALDQLTAELVSFVELDAPDPAGAILYGLDQVIAEAAAEESLDGKPVTITGATAGPIPGRSADLRRCLSNAVRNAQRYARSRVWVVIEDGAWLRVHVDDDGAGIPEASAELVFEPFARLEASRDRRTGGVGLGLAIARRCAERLGGTLVAGRSPLLGGARITLSIPRRAAS
jgi:two-component system sensor histidine kinase RstB